MPLIVEHIVETPRHMQGNVPQLAEAPRLNLESVASNNQEDQSNLGIFNNSERRVRN